MYTRDVQIVHREEQNTGLCGNTMCTPVVLQVYTCGMYIVLAWWVYCSPWSKSGKMQLFGHFKAVLAIYASVYTWYVDCTPVECTPVL